MGKIAKKIRHGIIEGPSRPKFDRSNWKLMLEDESLDDDDRRILNAGLIFDEILTFIRGEVGLDDLEISFDDVVSCAIAIVSLNYFRIARAAGDQSQQGALKDRLIVSKVMEATIALRTGECFTPDALITGMGDGMRYFLRQILSGKNILKPVTNLVDQSSMDLIQFELNKATLYHCAVEYWNDCVGSGYELTLREGGILHAPAPSQLEMAKAKAVSTYRRLSIELQDSMGFVEMWKYKIPRKVKERMCEIPLVSGISGDGRIENIDLGISDNALFASSTTIGAKLFLRTGYYKFLVDEPLQNFSNVTLNQIILGWQLLQSLSNQIFNSFKPIDASDTKKLLKFAPKIPKRILSATFSRALSISRQQADILIGVFTFNLNGHSQDVWSQPLIPVQDYFYLVIPCIHSVHLQRNAEAWMRHGGLTLSKRGLQFEGYCREVVAESLKKSPIKKFIALIDSGVSLMEPLDKKEQIDIVIVIGDTILLVEAKCILWPSDSLEFAKYRETIEYAASQIIRKKEVVGREYEHFRSRLRKMGYASPDKCRLVACVLTNSSIFSGYPINGVSIVDLSILGGFFQNEHIKLEGRQKGETIQRHVINFYGDIKQAEAILEKYLSDPPQLSDSRGSVKIREINFPIGSVTYGKIMHREHYVEIDVDEMQKKYGNFCL